MSILREADIRQTAGKLIELLHGKQRRFHNLNHRPHCDFEFKNSQNECIWKGNCEMAPALRTNIWFISMQHSDCFVNYYGWFFRRVSRAVLCSETTHCENYWSMISRNSKTAVFLWVLNPVEEKEAMRCFLFSKASVAIITVSHLLIPITLDNS